MSETIWDRLEEGVAQLSEPFRASEIVGWFRRHYPEVKEQSLRAHIQGATSNASSASRGAFANRRPVITRVDHGLYTRYQQIVDSPRSQMRLQPGVVERLPVVDIKRAVRGYLVDRRPAARCASLDYYFNHHFQQHRAGVSAWGEPTDMEVSCLHLGFYLAPAPAATPTTSAEAPNVARYRPMMLLAPS